MSFLTKLPESLYEPRAFADFTGAASFTLGDARALAWMSQLSYETDEPKKIDDILARWGLARVPGGLLVEEVVTVLPKASTHCLVAVGKGATIVAFAGTDPLVLANWITDFDIHITKTTKAAVGYDTAVAAVWDRLRPLVQAAVVSNSKLFVVGHSLGGALAVLTADRIDRDTDLKASVQGVYTFGMPRAGTPAFADRYNPRLGARTYRLVHAEDLVPTVAPSFLDFHHVGRYLHCGRTGKFDPSQLAPGTVSDDPPFVKGVSKQLAKMLHDPLSTVMSPAERIKLVSALALGQGHPDMRTDLAGLIIELLPPRLRDHMTDRYIGGC
jgi:triacylglycerol lipase